MKTLREKFELRVDRRDTGCWHWTGTRSGSNNAYGLFYLNATRTQYAHRWSYTQFVGPIPDGYEIDHLCRNPICVNPAHLEAVTHRENMLRGNTLPAACARRTHCAKGHEYTEANTRMYRGTRCCRRCGAQRERDRRRRLRLALATALVVMGLSQPVASAHWAPWLPRHNSSHAVRLAWCGNDRTWCLGAREAWQVAGCESKWNQWAVNGQFLGLWQLGSYARGRFGFRWDPWSQARAAHRYWLDAGWTPWSCSWAIGWSWNDPDAAEWT